MTASSSRRAHGDWQTPDDLARRVLAVVAAQIPRPPRAVLEPTCGRGSLLAAAAEAFPRAALAGYDVAPDHLAAATACLGSRARIRRADVFATDWEREIEVLDDPILVLGNPPWVTSAALGALGSTNHPAKSNWKGLRGLDARTGRSNFDVSEWILLRLLDALSGRGATLAMICKAAVARRVVEIAAGRGPALRPGGTWAIDAGRCFSAAVDAVLFVAHLSPAPFAASWPVHASLDAPSPGSAFGVADGVVVADLDAHARTRHLAGSCDPEWRSGPKHDCARVMELSRRGPALVNGEGEEVDVEPAFVHPLLKSTDLAHGRTAPDRAVILPQRALGEDTTALRARAPRLWAYLDRHRDALAARKSSVYRGRPPFAVFGVGDYSFAPWKVAVSGLHPRMRFSVIGPHEGRSVVVDDTSYFLPFSTGGDAEAAAIALRSEAAAEFFRGRIFADEKRPVTKAVLQALDLRRISPSGR